MTNNKLDSISLGIISVVVFLVPIFFIPIIFIPLQETKTILLVAGVLIAVILWTIARLKEDSVTIPNEKFIIPLILLPFIALLSSFFSGDISNSLVGQGIETDTVLISFVLTLGFLIGMYLFKTRTSVNRLYLLIAVSALILSLYQILKLLIGGDFLSFNLFIGNTANLLGKWNDMAIFAGLATLLSYITISMLKPKGFLRLFWYTVFVASISILAVVNLFMIWIVLGVITLIISLLAFTNNKFSKDSIEEDSTNPTYRNKIPGLALFILVVSILFIFAGSSFEKFINNQFGISQIEARPSWQSTLTLTKEVYSDRIIFGAGPNNFTKEWLKYKPESINSTVFWNVDFPSGVGIIPTLFITHGIFSTILWLVFMVLFLLAGMRTLIKNNLTTFDNYLATASFFSAVFLWTLSILYIPSLILFFFAFLFSGIFVAVGIQSGTIKQKKLIFKENLRTSLLGVWLLLIFLVILSTSLFFAVKKFTSIVYIYKASVEININGDIDKTEEQINKAILFNKSDFVYRTYTELLIFKIINIINNVEATTEVQKQFQSILSQAISTANLAISLDDRNYNNWIMLGRVYETIIPIRVEGAYNKAKVSYEKALSLNPKSPEVALSLARIDVLNGNNETARQRITDTLLIKNDYIGAIYLLSQIEINEGNVPEAIKTVEVASLLTPRNPLIFFQLGILKYSEEDYKGSIIALERAVILDNQYSNARYFLGLSYYKLDMIKKAIDQFSVVSSLNPDNVEVMVILNNLKVGRAPFEAPSTSDDPIKELELPIEE